SLGKAVPLNRDDIATEGVEVPFSGRGSVSGREARGPLLIRIGSRRRAVRVPAIVELGHSIVLIECAAEPGREFDATVRAVRKLRADQPTRGVVVQDRRHADLLWLCEAMPARGHVRLELQNRLALIVEDRLSAA